jgi:hypothetical protein
MFIVQGPCGAELAIVASDAIEDPNARGWEHVSVSTSRRPPNWREMCWVKGLFWGDEDCVVQFHPRRSQYVDIHPYTLHMWHRPEGFPEPPSILVGPRMEAP